RSLVEGQELSSFQQQAVVWTPDSVRQALDNVVKQNCCWGKKPVEEMEIKSMIQSDLWYIKMISFTEARSTEKKSGPYKGGDVDKDGTPPGEWSMDVPQPEHFESSTKRYKVPYSEVLTQCQKCGGRGNTTCKLCDGYGWIWCKKCNGKRWLWCSKCEKKGTAGKGRGSTSGGDGEKGAGKNSSKGHDEKGGGKDSSKGHDDDKGYGKGGTDYEDKGKGRGSMDGSKGAEKGKGKDTYKGYDDKGDGKGKSGYEDSGKGRGSMEKGAGKNSSKGHDEKGGGKDSSKGHDDDKGHGKGGTDYEDKGKGRGSMDGSKGAEKGSGKDSSKGHGKDNSSSSSSSDAEEEEECGVCKNSGWYWCKPCDSKGWKHCQKCKQSGRVTCEDCEGCGMLLSYSELVVVHSNHKWEKKWSAAESPVTVQELRESSGRVMCFQAKWVEEEFHRANVAPDPPSNVPWQLAVLAEPLCTVHKAVRLAKLPADAAGCRVVVVGDGAVGLLLLQVLRAKGAWVAVVGGTSSRRRRAAALGADMVLNASDGPVSLAESLASKDPGAELPSLAFEAAGHPAAVSSAVRLVAPGGRVILLGLSGNQLAEICTDEVVLRQLTIQGSLSSDPEDWPAVQELLSRGQLESVVTHVMQGLENYTEAIEKVRCPPEGMIKVIVEPEGKTDKRRRTAPMPMGGQLGAQGQGDPEMKFAATGPRTYRMAEEVKGTRFAVHVNGKGCSSLDSWHEPLRAAAVLLKNERLSLVLPKSGGSHFMCGTFAAPRCPRYVALVTILGLLYLVAESPGQSEELGADMTRLIVLTDRRSLVVGWVPLDHGTRGGRPDLEAGEGMVTLRVPLHKTATGGGVEMTFRQLRCACRAASAPLCPYHAALRHIARLKAAGVWFRDRPLFQV
ncbi:Ssuh2, partial [Symbiodinium sp. CCMP2456]